MGANSKIEWTHYTFNPWIGCAKVHTGCANCYAEADMDTRRGRVQWGHEGTRSKTSATYWQQPERWNAEAHRTKMNHAWASSLAVGEYDTPGPYDRPRVFCASLADVFEEYAGHVLDHAGVRLYRDAAGQITREPAAGLNANQPVFLDHLRSDLFDLIDRTRQLDWLLLTKRPENVRQMWKSAKAYADGGHCQPRRNVWLGASASDQHTFDRMVPSLLAAGLDVLPAVLFLSLEPLTGPVDMTAFLWEQNVAMPRRWVIVGGESGPSARPCRLEWVSSIVDQCAEADIPVFMKQLGANPTTKTADGIQHLTLKNRKGGEPYEWPRNVRVRYFPDVEKIDS